MPVDATPGVRDAMRLLIAAWFSVMTGLAWGGDDSVAGTLGGGSPKGMFSIVGEAVTDAVRREYPGSSLAYESGNNAGSLLRMLEGEIDFAMAAPGEVEAALNGEWPFPRQFGLDDFGLVARLIDGLAGYVVASAEFLDRHGVSSLADLREARIPVRLSTNQLGNLSTVRFGRAVLGAYGIDEPMIESWGGRDYHLPNSASFDLLRDGRLDMIITLGLHPEARVLMAATKRPIRFVHLDEEAARRAAEDLNTGIDTIPAGTYDFLTADYSAPSFGGGIAASASSDIERVYRVARAIHRQFDYVRSVHPALNNLTAQMLVRAEPYRLHPGAANYYRDAGLLPR